MKSRIARSRTGATFIAHYTPKQTRAEMEAVRFIAARAMEGRPPFEGALRFRAAFYRSVPQSWSQKKRAAALAGQILPITKPDADNCAKVKDGCTGIVWRDDAQITDEHLFKRIPNNLAS